MKSSALKDLVVGRRDIAKITGLGLGTIGKNIEAGVIPGQKSGRDYVALRAELDEFMASPAYSRLLSKVRNARVNFQGRTSSAAAQDANRMIAEALELLRAIRAEVAAIKEIVGPYQPSPPKAD